MRSRTFAGLFFACILLLAVADAYGLLPSSRSPSYAFVTSFENYQLSAGSHHHCRIQALVPTTLVKAKPSSHDRDLLHGATAVAVTVAGYCGDIAKTWQRVKVDLREPSKLEFEFEPETDIVGGVLVIGLVVVLLGLWIVRRAGPWVCRRLERRIERDPAFPEARVHDDRERDK